MAFERVSLYDAPQVMAGQAIGGHINPLRPVDTAQRLMSTVFTPDKLSPEERKTVIDRLFGEDDGVGQDILEIASNPLVLGLLFLTPTGYRAATKGASLFQVAEKYGWYNSSFGAFKKLFLSPIQTTRGSEAPALLIQHALRKEQLTREVTGEVRHGRNRMLAHLQRIVESRSGPKEARKLKSLDLGEHLHLPEESAARKTLEEFWTVLAVRQHGLDGALTRNVKRGSGKHFRVLDTSTGESFDISEIFGEQWRNLTQDAGDRRRVMDLFAGKYRKEIQRELDAMPEKKRRALLRALHEGDVENRYRFEEVPGSIETIQVQEWGESLLDGDALREYRRLSEIFDDQGALTELLASEAEARRRAYVHLLGDEAHFAAAGEFLADRNKLAMALSAMARGDAADLADEYAAQAVEGAELIRDRIMGPRWAQELPPSLRDLTAKDLATMTGKQWEATLDDVEELLRLDPDEWVSEKWQPRFSRRFQRVGGEEPIPAEGYFDRADGQQPFAGFSRHVWPVTSKESQIDLGDLELVKRTLQGGLSKEGQRKWQEWAANAKRAAESGNPKNLLRAHTLDVLAANDEYVRSTLASAALQTTAIDDAVMAADSLVHAGSPAFRKGELPILPGWQWATPAGVRKGLDVTRPLAEGQVHRERVSLGMAMDRMYARTVEPSKQRYLREVVRPAMSEVLDYDEISAIAAAHRNKEVARWMRTKFLPLQWVKDTDAGRAMLGYLERVENAPIAYRSKLMKGPTQKAAQWFYLTHLGANMASVTLNMMQPLVTVAPHVSLKDLAGAYRESFKEMGEYVGARLKMGLFPSAEDKLTVMKGAFRHFDEMGVGPDFYQLIDERMKTQSGAFDKFGHLLMSGFEKAEWLNRGVSAHAMERMYRRTGGPTGQALKNDIRQFVLETQFGAQHINTPGLFLAPGSPLSNVLVRQFMSFPLRAFTNAAVTGPMLGGRDWQSGFLSQTMRGLGVSALVYEGANALAGVDLSRGLYGQSSTEIVGGRSLLESEGGILGNISPPVLDVPVQVLQGATSGDAAKLMQGISRLVPGGVALNRAVNVAPGWDALRGAQQTYAGWHQIQPGGMVPVYRRDGALVEMRHWAELAGRGLGLDLGAWKNQGELDNYLVKQRDLMSQMKNDYMRRLRANDIAGASRVRAEWNRKFKDKNGKPMPMVVTKAQMGRYLDNQVRGRTERILDRLPPEVRGRYAALVEEAGYARNVPATAGHTARLRDPYRQAPPQLPIGEMLSRDAEAS